MKRRGYAASDAQRTYRSIEAENARAEIARSHIPVVATPVAPPPPVDNRDPVEMARAAQAALHGGA